MATPERRSRRVLRAMSSATATRLAVLLGVALALPALEIGWFNDDFMQVLVDEGAFPFLPHRAWQAYDFTPPGVTAGDLVARGHLPWFTDPALSFRFLRPLSSLSLALDHRLFGRDPLGGHLHSLAWYALLLVAVASVHRRVLRPAEATVATAIYAVAGSPGMALAWIAARHALMGGALAALALALHLAGRQSAGRQGAGQQGGRRGPWLASIAVLVIGLLTSEGVLAVVPFLVLYELLVSEDRPLRRAVAGGVPVALALAHLGFYATQGFGVKASGAYLSPFADPGPFALALLERGPILLAEMYGATPSVMWAAAPGVGPFLLGWGLVTVTLVLGLLWLARDQLRRRERRHLAWLFLSSVAAVAPSVGGFLGGRLLLVAGIGASSLLGVAIVQTLLLRPSGRARWPRRAGVALLVLLHLGLAPLFRVGMFAICGQLAEGERRLAEELDVAACREGAHLLVLEGADPALSMYVSPATRFYRPRIADRLGSIQALSMVAAEHRFEQLEDGAFTLRIEAEPRPDPMFERVHRAAPFAPGDVVEAGPLTVTILDAEGGLWTEARFELAEGESACLGIWDGTRLRVVPPPLPGEVRTLPHHIGPNGT